MGFTGIMTELTLQEKLRANKARSIAQADATANKEKQQGILQQQTQQKNNEIHLKRLKEYEKQTADYEKQKITQENKIAELKKQQQIKDNELAEIEKKEVQRKAVLQTNIDSINTSFDVEKKSITDQINEINAWRNKNNIRTSSPQLRGLNSELDRIKTQKFRAIEDITFRSETGFNRAVTQNESKLLSQGISLRRVVNITNDRIELGRLRAIKNSTQNAKSDAIKFREQNQIIIKEFESKRDSTGIQLTASMQKLTGIKQQIATKSKPEIKSRQFLEKLQKAPISIIGYTPELSNKAVTTFKETQFQQQKLFKSVTGAKDYKHAIKFRESAMENNPYVGTANSILNKKSNKVVESSGVLIEKKLRKKDDIFEELAKPISPKQNDNSIQTDVIPLENSKPEIETKVIHPQIPTYEFPEKIIPRYNAPKYYDTWSIMSTLLDIEAKTPSKTDKLLNQYIQNNQKSIQNTKETGEATVIKIPAINAVRDYGVEFGLGLASLYATARGKLYNEPELTTRQKIQKIYDSTPHEKSLEAVLFDSAISQSRYNPTISLSNVTPSVIPKKESTSIPTSSSYINQKTNTWEGAEYLAGTIGISLLGAFIPFGRGKSIIGQATKPILKTPDNLAYLLKASYQEPKIITKKVRVADGGTINVIDFDAMKKVKTTPYMPSIPEKIMKKSNKLKKGLSNKADQTISKQIRKLEFEDTMYKHELEKAYPTKPYSTKQKGAKSKKDTINPTSSISKANRKSKFESDMIHHKSNPVKTPKSETPMLDKLLGRPSRYVKTSAKINNKKLKDKSSQIKDTFSDTINDNILDPISKRTKKPIGKFVRKAKVSKQIKGFDLEKMSKQYTTSKKYDVTESMKTTEINQNVFNDIIKKNIKKKKLTKPQKAESGWKYNKANNYNPDISKSSSSKSSMAEQLLEPKSKVKSTTKPSNKPKKKQSDITIVEQVLHPNRPQIKSSQTPLLDSLLGKSTSQRNTIKQDVIPKTQQTPVLDDIIKQNSKLENSPGTTPKKKPKTMLYDLLVQPGKQGIKTNQDYSFVYGHPPELITKPIQETPQKTRTKTPKIPPVSIKTTEIGIGKPNHSTKRKRRHAARYSIWNVDVDRIGTLPGDELVASKSTKIFKDLDKRQKAHTKSASKSKSTTRKTLKKSIRKSTPKRKPSSKKIKEG